MLYLLTLLKESHCTEGNTASRWMLSIRSRFFDAILERDEASSGLTAMSLMS